MDLALNYLEWLICRKTKPNSALLKPCKQRSCPVSKACNMLSVLSALR